MRLYFQHQVYKVRRRIAFNIKFSPQQRTQIIYIRTTNVALVGTRMNGNTVCSKRFTIKRYLYYIGNISPRAFLSVAILFMFTLNLVIVLRYICRKNTNIIISCLIIRNAFSVLFWLFKVEIQEKMPNLQPKPIYSL